MKVSWIFLLCVASGIWENKGCSSFSFSCFVVCCYVAVFLIFVLKQRTVLEKGITAYDFVVSFMCMAYSFQVSGHEHSDGSKVLLYNGDGEKGV